MKVSVLVAHLLTLPQDAEVVYSSSEGCHECNPECFEIYHSIDSKPEYKERGDYPNDRDIHLVVIGG